MQPAELALEVALLVMQNGGSSEMAERTFNNILKGYKLSGVTISLRLDIITINIMEEDKSTNISRPVGIIGINLVRTSQAMLLGERIAKGDIETAELESEIKRIRTLVTPYQRWLMILTAAFTCAFFTQISSGDWGALGIAFVASGIGQVLRTHLQKKNVTVVTITFICSILSVCIAAAGLRMGLSQTIPSTLISSLFYMVPGLPLINGFIDMISHKYLFVGLERIANATFLFLVLAIAVAFAYTAFFLKSI